VHRNFPGTQIILKEQGNPQFSEHTALFATIAQPCFKLLSPSSFIGLASPKAHQANWRKAKDVNICYIAVT
jgi:hypothetical protein